MHCICLIFWVVLVLWCVSLFEYNLILTSYQSLKPWVGLSVWVMICPSSSHNFLLWIRTDQSALIKSGSLNIIFILFSCVEGQRANDPARLFNSVKVAESNKDYLEKFQLCCVIKIHLCLEHRKHFRFKHPAFEKQRLIPLPNISLLCTKLRAQDFVTSHIVFIHSFDPDIP